MRLNQVNEKAARTAAKKGIKCFTRRMIQGHRVEFADFLLNGKPKPGVFPQVSGRRRK